MIVTKTKNTLSTFGFRACIAARAMAASRDPVARHLGIEMLPFLEAWSREEELIACLTEEARVEAMKAKAYVRERKDEFDPAAPPRSSRDLSLSQMAEVLLNPEALRVDELGLRMGVSVNRITYLRAQHRRAQGMDGTADRRRTPAHLEPFPHGAWGGGPLECPTPGLQRYPTRLAATTRWLELRPLMTSAQEQGAAYEPLRPLSLRQDYMERHERQTVSTPRASPVAAAPLDNRRSAVDAELEEITDVGDINSAMIAPRANPSAELVLPHDVLAHARTLDATDFQAESE